MSSEIICRSRGKDYDEHGAAIHPTFLRRAGFGGGRRLVC
jgi:hypothetical protein